MCRSLRAEVFQSVQLREDGKGGGTEELTSVPSRRRTSVLEVSQGPSSAGFQSAFEFRCIHHLRGSSRLPYYALWVVDVLYGEVHTDAFGGDLELLGRVAVRHEAEHHEEAHDRLQGQFLEGCDVDCLAVVTEPVAVWRALDKHDHN